MQAYDISDGREPEIKYVVEDLCEAYQEGLAIWDSKIGPLVFGEDVGLAQELRLSFDEGNKELGRVYTGFYKLAGKHFASGDTETESLLAEQLYILNNEVIDKIQQATDDSIAGIPSLPGSFRKTTILNYAWLLRKSVAVKKKSLSALELLFNNIQTWAVPLHTLPPAASSSKDRSTPLVSDTSATDAEGLFERVKAPFLRQRYTYDELNSPYTIRLIKIKTSRPWVTLEIAQFDLSDLPQFKALSYCWGKAGQKSEIWCNDLVFKVSPNLRKGLQRLHQYSTRYNSRSKGWFWIDQICINQADAIERMRQLRLMRAIYQRSVNTVIWLGPDDGNTDLASSLITIIYNLSLSFQAKEKRTNDEVLAKANIPQTEETIALPPRDDKRWGALSRFLENGWFERCWIIQEVVVSSGDPDMLCGKHQLLWSRFQKAMMWLYQYDSQYSNDRLQLIKGISDLSSSRDVWELQALLYSTRAFLATDPKDKIFSLFGLVGETEAPERWPTALSPNYSRTLRDVYMATTMYCIQQTKSLSILSQVGGNGETNQNAEDHPFPSWVPRWDRPQSWMSLSSFEVRDNKVGWKTLVEKFNYASKELPVSLDTYTPPDVLRLEGLNLCVVESCLPVTSSEPSNSKSSARAHGILLKQIPDLYRICERRLDDLSPEALSRSFFLVTTAGLTPERTDAHKEPLTHFHAFLNSVMPTTPGSQNDAHSIFSISSALKSNLSISTLSANLSPSTASDSMSPPFSQPRPSSSTSTSHSRNRSVVQTRDMNEADPSRYTSALVPMAHRRLFITSQGQLGLGPANMMSGDVVVVLFGGKVPFILRNTGDDQWRLLGECYVDGLMQGEGLVSRGRVPEHQLETEWFDLV